jgi:hypothetical protein
LPRCPFFCLFGTWAGTLRSVAFLCIRYTQTSTSRPGWLEVLSATPGLLDDPELLVTTVREQLESSHSVRPPRVFVAKDQLSSELGLRVAAELALPLFTDSRLMASESALCSWHQELGAGTLQVVITDDATGQLLALLRDRGFADRVLGKIPSRERAPGRVGRAGAPRARL